ncbi:MAG TPA: response regulator [Bacteroidota bacterium]|nr:response regulator [Bacteroidota bacterium]
MAHSLRALVIEEDPNILSAFNEFLRNENCEMLSAFNTQKALQILLGTEIHLVIADVNVPDEAGLSFCQTFKHSRPHVPIIVISHDSHGGAEDEARRAGASQYFSKPLELDALRKAVRKCLHRSTSVGSARD